MIRISVPGEFDGANAYLDLETVKVPTVGPFVMRNGEVLRNRWSIAMAGIGLGGEIVLLESRPFGDFGDDAILREIGNELALADSVLYSATRQFDEMICKGRFTNARRAHESEPFFPAVPGAADLNWRCVPPSPLTDYPGRGADVPSREVPAALARGDRAVVLVHLLRDVAEMIWAFGKADAECRAWCARVLTDYRFAYGLVS